MDYADLCARIYIYIYIYVYHIIQSSYNMNHSTHLPKSGLRGIIESLKLTPITGCISSARWSNDNDLTGLPHIGLRSGLEQSSPDGRKSQVCEIFINILKFPQEHWVYPFALYLGFANRCDVPRALRAASRSLWVAGPSGAFTLDGAWTEMSRVWPWLPFGSLGKAPHF